MQLQKFAKSEPHTRIIANFYIDDERQLGNSALRRFDAVWRARAAEGRLPAREDIDPADIADLLGDLMLVDVIQAGDDTVWFRSRLVGERHIGIDGRSAAGDYLFGNPDETDEMAEVVATGRPHYARCRIEGHPAGADDFERVTYPFASNGADVDSIVSVLVPRETRKSRLHTFFSWF